MGRVVRRGEFRRPRPEEVEAFEHLQQRGYASGSPTLGPRQGGSDATRESDEVPAEASTESTEEPAESTASGAPVSGEGEGPRARDGGEPPGDGKKGPVAGDRKEERETARAYFVDGRPVAGAYVKRYDTWWGTEVLPMESVGGVVALPEARRCGYTAEVMAGIVGDMHERGVPISTITTPFAYAFYRRMGWEYAFRRLRARFAPRLVASLGADAHGAARFVRWPPTVAGEPGLEAMDAIYAQVMRARYQCAAARPPELWREHLRGKHTYAYIWEADGRRSGYGIFRVGREDMVEVRELFALDGHAWCGLLGLLANFDSQAEKVEWDMAPDLRLDLVVPEQNDLELEATAEGMFRVIDLAAALTARTYPPAVGRVCLRLSDEQAPWNQGPFDVEWCGGRVEVRAARGGAAAADSAAMDQRVFAQIYAGTVSPAEAARWRGADIGVRALAVLTQAFVTGRPPLLLESF